MQDFWLQNALKGRRFTVDIAVPEVITTETKGARAILLAVIGDLVAAEAILANYRCRWT